MRVVVRVVVPSATNSPPPSVCHKFKGHGRKTVNSGQLVRSLLRGDAVSERSDCQTRKHVSESEHPNGAMASTHVGSVGVDLAGLEGDNRWCALIARSDVDATSPLPNNKARQ